MQPPKVAQKSLQFNFIEENLGDILSKRLLRATNGIRALM
jgi:hypothetical protein